MFFGSSDVDARRLGGQKCTWGPSYWCKNIRQGVCRVKNSDFSRMRTRELKRRNNHVVRTWAKLKNRKQNDDQGAGA